MLQQPGLFEKKPLSLFEHNVPRATSLYFLALPRLICAPRYAHNDPKLRTNSYPGTLSRVLPWIEEARQPVARNPRQILADLPSLLRRAGCPITGVPRS